MKLVLFDDYKLGVIKGNSVVDVRPAVADLVHTSPQDLMTQLIRNFDRYRGPMEELVRSARGVSLRQVRLRAPLPAPTRIVAMAVNYMEHGTRQKGADIDAFLKSASTVIGDGDTVVLPDVQPTVFEQEAELGLIIGKKASKVKPEEAYDYIFGYTNFIDVSARGFRPENRPSFFWGKSWDTFGPMGPAVVTADEIADPMNLNVKCWINGKLYQDYPTSDMANDIPHLMEWATWITTLQPGDLVACGTNHTGLCAIQNGDRIEVETQGLGRLTVQVKDELGREWPRMPRREKTPEQIKAIGGPASFERLGKR
ncbi:MAG: FAA hydrolase family protein [Dehalococcoidia bacterium]|nr:FAA hydrolase family protein [Dehalococcoidia bacterium]MSQ16536.1 FAA hydrolase family protein [Dehalococcoidia bacterium]